MAFLALSWLSMCAIAVPCLLGRIFTCSVCVCGVGGVCGCVVGGDQ